MSQLIPVYSLTQNTSWFYQVLESNINILNKHGFELGPRDPKSFVQTRQSEFWFYPEKIADKFNQVRKKLEEGISVILVGSYQTIPRHKQFISALREYGIGNICRITPWIAVGPPLGALEINGRASYKNFDLSTYGNALDLGKELGRTVREVQRDFGAENTVIQADLASFSTPEAGCALGRDFFAYLGIEGELQKPRPLALNLFFNSATAIRLLEAARVRDNAWPRMNDAAYLDKLTEFDTIWRPEPCIPLDQRISYANDPQIIKAQKALEDICGLAAGSMNPPAWFQSKPALAPADSLDKDRVRDFAASLPEDVRQTVAARFANDEKYLDADQRLFAEVLAERRRDFVSIGEPVEPPVLTVLTMTRNHEKYIAECMDSVLRQKTDFPVRHLVLDHYSSDSTPDIINSYAAKYPSIRPVLLSYYSHHYNNVHDLLDRCQSKYAALCDGDDYFIDENKLQMQVDFLENNPRCALVFHPVMITYENGDPPRYYPPVDALPRRKKIEFYLHDLIKGNLIQTNSVVYRWRFPDGLPDWFDANVCPGDWYWHLLHAEMGKIGFIPKTMSVYRRHANALFNNSMVDSVKHRRDFGMSELHAYKVYNDHFNGRYFPQLASLAMGVFIDLLKLSERENDSSLFELATFKYPEFAQYFMKNLIKCDADGNPIGDTPSQQDMDASEERK